MVERRVRDAEAASSNLVASMRMRSPETLRNQGFWGFFFAKKRQEYWTYDLKMLSPLEPLGFLFQCLIHFEIDFEPLFEPLLFQLGERFCKIPSPCMWKGKSWGLFYCKYGR